MLFHAHPIRFYQFSSSKKHSLCTSLVSHHIRFFFHSTEASQRRNFFNTNFNTEFDVFARLPYHQVNPASFIGRSSHDADLNFWLILQFDAFFQNFACMLTHSSLCFAAFGRFDGKCGQFSRLLQQLESVLCSEQQNSKICRCKKELN